MDALFDITQEEIPVFLAEAYEQFQILDEGLVKLERMEQDTALHQALIRAAHTLKGSAGMIHHNQMVELTHTLEAAFDRLRMDELAIRAGLIDACLEAVDLLRLLCEEVPRGESSGVDIAGAVALLAAAVLPAGSQAVSGGVSENLEKGGSRTLALGRSCTPAPTRSATASGTEQQSANGAENTQPGAPISNLFNKFSRLVRDLVRKAGKQVELVTRGEDTELDRSVIEEVSDPIIHLLRNAVDHGLETPEERQAAGKPG